MAIKSRFLISTTLILLLTCFFSWLSMRVLAEDIIGSWVERYAEKQVRYDKVRTLLPLIQEVNLSKEFANLNALTLWAKNPNDDNLKAQALKETEKFRPRFSDGSYFIALKGNDRYYYSDGEKPINSDYYRYTLDASKKSDAWFYGIMEKNLDLHLNVNPDVELGVVKLWSDVLIREGDEVLGVVGTGLDLSTFLNQMVEKQDIYSAILFTSPEGSIQLYQNEALISFSSLTNESNNQKCIFKLLDDEASQAILKSTYALAKESPNHVETAVVKKDGVRQLASVIYIPEIDWFQVNFIDINNFLPFSEFSGLLIVFAISLVLALLIVYLLLAVIVTKPIAELESSIRALGENQYKAPKLSRFAGPEIKRLVAHYRNISKTLLSYQQELEEKVATRTAELSRLSKRDPLTELYNRRGFEMHMADYMQKWESARTPFGLINVDVDRFKSINDQYGHGAGDLVLQRISDYLIEIVGESGEVSRWGGDEFLILVKQADVASLARISKQLSGKSKPLTIDIKDQNITIQFSVGSALVQEEDTLADILHRADKAMYAVKFAGRD